jgi:AraC family transcriptional activator of pobA
MAKKSTADPSEFVSLFTFEELLRDVEFDLRVKEFVVMEIDKANYAQIISAFLWYSRGSIRFRLDDKSYDVSEGDVIFCPFSEIFWVDMISDDYRAKYIFFSLDFISDAGFNYKSNDVLKSLSSDPTHIIRSEPDLYRRLDFHLDELKALNTMEKDNYYFNEMIWHHFSLVIYEIDNYFKKIEKPHQVDAS